jgi:two-component system NtrC family sensor kinase
MKVLITDDDAVTRHLLQNYLAKWGHEVTATADGEEAWRLFQDGTFSLVISDWMMPQMDGPELVRKIRGTHRPGYVYVILLTARAQKTDVVQGMEAGADDFVAKPFDPEELRVRVRQGERIVRLEQSLEEQNVALRAAQAALVQNEKLASLGRLAAGMAHEINNPIAYVGNNVAVLRRDMLDALAVLDAYREGRRDEAVRLEQVMDFPFFRANFDRLCDKSLEGLQRVRDIVSNLRDFAHLDEAEFKDADLNAALASAIQVLRHAINTKEIRLETHLDPLPLLPCHPAKLNQVFLNLLSNAIQACPLGGRVEARSRFEPGKDIVIEIVDTGSGIKPEHMPRLFEPFFTTKPVGQGTGLGLAVSFGIVREHDGTIEVESKEGQGSTFRVRLPLRAP